MKAHAYYPLFADLSGRRCLIVGGGRIAQRKVTTLLEYGARITVISPHITPQLRIYARQGRVTHRARRFRASDVKGAWLVYAATDDQSINQAVSQATKAQRVFANIVDQTALCSFIAPSILRRGQLTVAVSTAGASPSLAKHLRRDLARTLGRDYAQMLRLLGRLRGIAKHRLPAYGDRKRYFDQVIQGNVFAFVRAGKPADAHREAMRLLDRFAHTRAR